MIIDFALGFAVAGWIVAVVVYMRQGEQLRRIESLELAVSDIEDDMAPYDKTDLYDEDDEWLVADEYDPDAWKYQ
jgi:hypothetical protein